MAGIPSGKKVQIALRLDPDVFAWVEQRAAANGITVAEQLRRIVKWGRFYADEQDAAPVKSPEEVCGRHSQ